MSKQLPYRAVTAHGDVVDVRFALHDETVSPMRVQQLLDALLAALDREIGVLGETANGDVLQALCMATAIRARIIHAPTEVTSQLARELLERALHGVAQAHHQPAHSGHA
ncbi:MAG: hypothetical protein JJU06_20030 [Ectothiorhodospiraceae bacterium]|nr:hypothetical protein [Ectothiorhodospiraceae bacterium]MCH8506927.1 hypothetical protein [Ectothiorhodospiraceae bacterium]